MQPVTCPECKQTTDLSPANPFRPFCSERCKMIDLGEWFGENRGIAAEEQDEWDGNPAPDNDYQ
ncbi:MAG: DNA gyrase inhibitor YacG [Oceanococcus sp.]